MEKIVITGMGVLAPGGKNVQEFWGNLKQGKSKIDKIKRFDTQKYNIDVHVVAEIPEVDFTDSLDPKIFKRMDINVVYAAYAAKEAIYQANLLDNKVNKEKVGIIIGSGIGGMSSWEKGINDFRDKGRMGPFFIPQVITNMASGIISMHYGFMGPNFSVSSACATSNHAILTAFHLLRSGECDIIIAGGTEASITPVSLASFAAAGAISKEKDPNLAFRPWDKQRNGFVMGEGAGVLILERESSAVKRDVDILGIVRGGGMSGDAYHMTAPHPEGKGAIMAMKKALETSQLKLEEIGYINAHGTSTPLGDLAETLSIKETFGQHAYNLKINTTKSMIGHLLGAAGAVEAVATIKSLQEQVVHPTIGIHELDEQCDLNYVRNQCQSINTRYALSNSFGFGGHNSSVIFEKI